MNTDHDKLPPENPPAFPVPIPRVSEGMSLRDWFAGQALTTLRVGDWTSADDGARYCYDYADAMLRARTKGQTNP